MAITLSISDVGDGTGATATVAGSTVGATNTVYVADWPGSSFASKGSRVGDGTVALAVLPGPHWACVRNTTEISNIVHFRTTDGSEATFYQCLRAVRDVIRGLALSGLDSANVDFKKLPFDLESALPGITVYPSREAFAPDGNLTFQGSYPVEIVMVRQKTGLESGVDSFLLWRQQIVRALIDKPLSGASGCYQVRIEPGVPWSVPAYMSAGLEVGVLVARCVTSERDIVF